MPFAACALGAITLNALFTLPTPQSPNQSLWRLCAVAQFEDLHALCDIIDQRLAVNTRRLLTQRALLHTHCA
jgi:hypothetical protein